MTTPRLPLVAQGSGKEVGWIELGEGGAEFSDDTAEKIFESVRRAGGWNDPDAFDALASGWSNGYLTIPASPNRDPGEAHVNERYNDQHAPAGSSTGGQFAPSSGGGGSKTKPTAPAKKAAPPHRPAHPSRKPDDGTLAYDPHSNHGTGYDSKAGDDRVHALQQALNRLGLTDADGKKLRDDGKLGPKTTAAVKKLQKALGLRPDGKVTAALLKQATSMKALPQKRSAFMDICVRSFDFESRARNADGRLLEGYAAVFNAPARIGAIGGDFDEVITPGAFARSLRSRTPVLQWDHGKDPSVGTAPIGDIEELSEDDHGLYVRARLYDHPSVERVRMAIAGKSVKGMSFRFQVPDGGDRWERRSGDVDLRTVGDADVFELGPVAFPAYDATSVSVRSLLAQLDADEHRTLLRELAYDLRSVDLSNLTGGSDAWSVDRGDLDLRPGSGDRSAQSIETSRLEEAALRAMGVL